MEKWKRGRVDFYTQRDEKNRPVDDKRARYLNRDMSTIYDYCDLVLSKSQYPEFFPKEYEIEFREDAGLLIVDYQLPPMEDFPKIREVKYIAARDEFDEKFVAPAELERIFDSVVYQVTLRTIYELFAADMVNALAGIVFNGIVHSIDRATGQEVSGCIVSLHASKDEFMAINLCNVDPKACFRKLKGVGSSKLHSLTPVAPVMAMEKEDKRFVESYAVAQTLDEGSNLALMDWEDFEHLIRELFEKEFAAAGGEVKVTQASRDGGVDAVVFDPDPIRGGKIVIQAKRYTNTVGVSAVRDLYGTLLNEGANKGILVSTSDYGPDAYDFAKGKPITLLSGGNLLHLLQKHGHKAHIDIKAAKQALSKEV
jgi:restriction system protein